MASIADLRLYLERVGNLAAILRELDHHLLVQPNIPGPVPAVDVAGLFDCAALIAPFRGHLDADQTRFTRSIFALATHKLR